MPDVLDDAYEQLHTKGPEFGGWLSNHGPMAADALLRLGRGAARRTRSASLMCRERIQFRVAAPPRTRPKGYTLSAICPPSLTPMCYRT